MRSSFVRFAVPFLTLVAMWTDPIAAQLCVGRVASEKAPARIGARYISYPESQNEYGLELGFAPASGLFGSAALAMTTVSQPNGTAKSGELWLGGAVAPKNSPFVVCPLTGLQLTALPTLNDVGVRVTAHTLAYSLGVSAGIPFDATPALQVVPFAGAYFQRQSFTLESTTDNVNNGLYEIGVAVVANRRFSIGPVMRNVFAIERPSRAAYGVVMSYGFGG